MVLTSSTKRRKSEDEVKSAIGVTTVAGCRPRKRHHEKKRGMRKEAKAETDGWQLLSPRANQNAVMKTGMLPVLHLLQKW